MAGPAYSYRNKSTLLATSAGRQIGEVNLKAVLLYLYLMESHDPNFTDTFLGILNLITQYLCSFYMYSTGILHKQCYLHTNYFLHSDLWFFKAYFLGHSVRNLTFH